ncbi:MAG: DUF4203 domain-containing protein [Planctomycetota bacterium]
MTPATPKKIMLPGSTARSAFNRPHHHPSSSETRMRRCGLFALLICAILSLGLSNIVNAAPPTPTASVGANGSSAAANAGTADDGSAAGGSLFDDVFTGDFAVNPFHVFTEGPHRLDILNHPGPLIDTLAQLHIVWAGIFVVCGLLSVFFGYRWHRWIVMLTAFIVGMAIGTALSAAVETQLIVATCVGVVLAIIAWPLMKYAVTICGALIGGFVGAHVWTTLNQPPDAIWAGALTGFMMFGLLSFLIHRAIIVTMTCVAGAFVLIMGVITMLVHVPAWELALRDAFSSNTVLIPLFVLTASVIGIVAQLDETRAPGAGGSSGGGPAGRSGGAGGGGGGGGGGAPRPGGAAR